ncbi:MAG: type II secretion system minor pseudopilin GspI, partial [Syntrophobacteria bacterium]
RSRQSNPNSSCQTIQWPFGSPGRISGVDAWRMAQGARHTAEKMLEVRGLRLEAKRQSRQVYTASNLKRGQTGRALLQPDPEPVPCGLGSRAGFTLIEVLVAVAILAIAMVAILKANVQNLDALTKSRETTTASLLAASKLAEIEAAGVANWGESQGDFGEDYPEFTWQVETTSTEVEGLERIAVIVQRSGGVAGREVRIEELMLVE